jgi:hypothetical protein
VTSLENPNRVVWIGEQPAPLCHIPWMGTVVVLADGNVNFCCYSSAVVGNVNQQGFDEIWNGPEMTGIRRSLAAQAFPPECRSVFCPLYRGDELTSLTSELEPHGFQVTGTHDPHAAIRERLRGTCLRLDGDIVALDICYRGDSMRADVFAAVQLADGRIRFLPSFEEFAIPIAYRLELSEDRAPFRVELAALSELGQAADRVNAALFVSGADPNRRSNCYWSDIQPLPVPDPEARTSER